jgi:glycosyltransferase involved in cell wall biosynthesis
MGFGGVANQAVSQTIALVAIGGTGWMGGASYIRNLAAAIHAADPHQPVRYLVGEPLAADWTGVEPRTVVATRSGFFRRLAGGTRLLAEAARDAFVYPLTYDNDYNLAAGWPLTQALGHTRWAGWIPDFQHRYLPELFPSEEIQRRDTCIGRLAEEAPRVVLSSESAAEDFRRFYPAHADKATVWRFSVPPLEIDDDSDATPPRFLLVCNQFWAHKNHLVIFQALRLLRDRGVRPLILCTGQLDDYRDRTYADKIRAALDGLGDQVTLLGLVPRARQLSLLRRALAVIQPSRFEGWSTVVEDCRALGRPMLLSDLPVHREQNPPGAHYFPPESAEALAELMDHAWKNFAPGPDEVAEEIARAQAQTRLVLAGRRFLELARA